MLRYKQQGRERKEVTGEKRRGGKGKERDSLMNCHKNLIRKKSKKRKP